jgi:hypothetical protein
VAAGTRCLRWIREPPPRSTRNCPLPSTVPSSQAHRASTRNTVTFTTGAALTTVVAPPAGFDPFTADPSTLRDYGYPDRPTEPAALAHWAALLGRTAG